MYSNNSKIAIGLIGALAGVRGVRGVLGLGTGIMFAGSSVNAGPNICARWFGSGGGMG